MFGQTPLNFNLNFSQRNDLKQEFFFVFLLFDRENQYFGLRKAKIRKDFFP